MGSCSSNAAGWTRVPPPCCCGCQHYRAVKMQWNTHPMESGNKFLIDAGNFVAATIEDTVHHAILVYVACGKCGKENRRTYELTDGVSKRSRWGYYGGGLYYKETLADTKLNVSYEKVEDIFRGMWEKKFDMASACDNNWARDFFDRVYYRSSNGCA
ncbi:hypothetical protein GPALN_012023 [Globodera pallida]|nr:hypothetical protein GPALN_012023 [Globodera pallida]